MTKLFLVLDPKFLDLVNAVRTCEHIFAPPAHLNGKDKANCDACHRRDTLGKERPCAKCSFFAVLVIAIVVEPVQCGVRECKPNCSHAIRAIAIAMLRGWCLSTKNNEVVFIGFNINREDRVKGNEALARLQLAGVQM